MTAAPVEIVVADDKDALAQLVGARLRTAIEAARNDGRPAEVGLTGGSMGGAAVAALVRAVQEDPVDLSDLGLWWGDERYLPLGDPERNDTQADDAGLGSLGLPDDAPPSALRAAAAEARAKVAGMQADLAVELDALGAPLPRDVDAPLLPFSVVQPARPAAAIEPISIVRREGGE